MTILNIYMYIYIHLKWIANKFHIAHETLLSVMWQLDGRGIAGRMDGVYVWLSPFDVHLKLSQHC